MQAEQVPAASQTLRWWRIKPSGSRTPNYTRNNTSVSLSQRCKNNSEDHHSTHGLGSFHVDLCFFFFFLTRRNEKGKRARPQSVDTLTSLAPKQFSFRVCRHCSGCEVSLTAVPSMEMFHSKLSIPRYTIYDVELVGNGREGQAKRAI